MPFAVIIKCTNDSARHIETLWSRMSLFENTSSMSAMNYPPHLTFAIYDDIDPKKLSDGLHHVFDKQAPLRLAFERLRYFETPRLVPWAAPTDTGALQTLHQALHNHMDPSLCREHYRPGTWVPHVTLATDVREDQRVNALLFCTEPIKPFEMVFDVADCVTFPPVEILDHVPLTA